MKPETPLDRRHSTGAIAAIMTVVLLSGAAFAYSAGWVSPRRLTPAKLVASLAPPTGPALGHRRNHAKGICFTGSFEANGVGRTLSRALVFNTGQYPVIGRFNTATADPNSSDGIQRVRGIGLKISMPDGREWRTAMIDAPFFPVSTPQAFYELQVASKSTNPDTMKKFTAHHPEITNFGAWAKSAAWTGSYAEERYNALNAFRFLDGSGGSRIVRWSLVPRSNVTAVPPEELAKRDPDFLETEITQRVSVSPVRWDLVITVAEPKDPTTDPSKMWPDTRRTINVGTLVVDRIEPERDGPCRDINFDPTILPPGITTSDDPFPAARSAAYSRSFNSRTAESKYYPRSISADTSERAHP